MVGSANFISEKVEFLNTLLSILLFSIVSCLSFVLHAKNTLAGPDSQIMYIDSQTRLDLMSYVLLPK